MSTTVLREELRRRTGLDTFEVEEQEPHEDGDDRYAIYSVWPETIRGARRHDGGRREIATTSAEGIGTCLVTLREEGQITNDSRVGILDRQERTWIVNPWAKGEAA